MNVRDFLTIVIVRSATYWIGVGGEPQVSLSLQSSDHSVLLPVSRLKLPRVSILRTQFQPAFGIRSHDGGDDDGGGGNDDKIVSVGGTGAAVATTMTNIPINLTKRDRRDVNTSGTKHQMDNNKLNYIDTINVLAESSFQEGEVGWSNINAEVDIIIPMILKHLQKLNVEYLQLPSLRETISVTPLIINYEVGLNLSNGIAYGLKGIRRFGDAFMTYTSDKSFLCRFNLIIKGLQSSFAKNSSLLGLLKFEYDFLIKLMAIEGYGRVTGLLEDTVIFGELGISVIDTRLKLHDLRVTSFRNIYVQLDQHHIIRELSGAILSPITNLFRDRITTSISDGLKEQIQLVMDDFSDKDPLQLKTFAKQILSGLTKE